MKKAVIYARVSSTIERNRQNTERQVADLNAYAEYSNLEVVEVFEEYISGGKKKGPSKGMASASRIIPARIDKDLENNMSFEIGNHEVVYSVSTEDYSDQLKNYKQVYVDSIDCGYRIYTQYEPNCVSVVYPLEDKLLIPVINLGN